MSVSQELALTQVQQGKFEEAERNLRVALDVGGDWPDDTSEGYRGVAGFAFVYAMTLADSGGGSRALDALEESIGLGFPSADALLDERWDSLRGDPRFETLNQRLVQRPSE